MRNGRQRAKDERIWKAIYKEAKARDDIRAAEKKKQTEQMSNKCNNFETNRADGYSIDQHKNSLDQQISNFQEVRAQSERYNAAPKLSCKRANMTLANGERITGVWKIVSAYHILPSHNPETFADSQNFPLNPSGKNVNDRNYATDRMAQSFVKSVAQRFDGRAIEEPIRISKDGIVVDGNNRTMSRIIAHKQQTDMAYIEALHDLASEKCMCHDDIAQIEAPTMVFEIDSEPNYSRQYFAQFNANTKKEKTAVDTVITLSSTVTQRVRNIINGEFDKYEDLSKLYASRPSITVIRNAIIDDGVIMEAEFNKYFDSKLGNFTDDGKKMLQRIVLSGVLSEDNVRVLDFDGLKNINEKLLYGIVPVTINQSLPTDYSLKSELNKAIDIIYAASMSNMSVADSISQSSMFSENEVKADYESLAVAIFLSKSKAQFKKIIGIYNTAAKAVQGGSLFGEADNRDKRQILKDTIDWMQSEKLLTDGDKYALQRYEKLEAKPKNVIDMLPSPRKKLSEAEKEFLTKQVKKETEKQAKPTPSVPKPKMDISKYKTGKITSKNFREFLIESGFELERDYRKGEKNISALDIGTYRFGKDINEDRIQVHYLKKSVSISNKYGMKEVIDKEYMHPIESIRLLDAIEFIADYLSSKNSEPKPAPSVQEPQFTDVETFIWFPSKGMENYYAFAEKLKASHSFRLYSGRIEANDNRLDSALSFINLFPIKKYCKVAVYTKENSFKDNDLNFEWIQRNGYNIGENVDISFPLFYEKIQPYLSKIYKIVFDLNGTEINSTPSVSKAQEVINDLKTALKYIKDTEKLKKHTSLVADLELAARYAKK